VSESVAIELEVNGRRHELVIEARETLADVLRLRLGLTGVKVSCDAQVCGTCTVLVDGEAVSGCSFLAADASGRSVRTVEGLAEAGRLSPLQVAFLEHHAFQCGYCTPGMLMAAAALLSSNATPSREDVVAAMDGNLCRCTGYSPIIAAILATAERA
jgi:aerobic-type carbon monoxide dehydrogenase small subunit (CoxS/CutS family)